MNGYTKSEIIKGRIKFITMSILGIILFLIPIPVVQDGQKQTTLPVDLTCVYKLLSTKELIHLKL